VWLEVGLWIEGKPLADGDGHDVDDVAFVVPLLQGNVEVYSLIPSIQIMDCSIVSFFSRRSRFNQTLESTVKVV
jgi:hypothetical protein